MALAAVQDILAAFPGWTTAFNLSYGDEASTQGSGQVRVAALRPALWQLAATSRSLRPSELRAWSARLASLENGKQLFYGYDLAGVYPILYPRGSWPTGTSFDGVSATVHTLDAGGKALRVDGLPAGYAVSVGDYLQITRAGDSQMLLFQAVEAATADGSGVTPLLEVRPGFAYAGLSVDDAVAVKRPACPMMLRPGSVNAAADIAGNGTLSFEAVQVIG